ncbi:MAG: hypothetical protein IJI14_15900 [Anaerolineaceae bacterium]|nr:hypothetical protein [Anaerolineaceae bacterium]
MRKKFLSVLLVIILSMFFVSSVFAEIDPTGQYFSTNVDDCYVADKNGWITGMKATYEISVKDATLFGAEYFMTYAFLDEMEFVSRIIDSENYTIDGNWAPYSVAKVYLDFRELAAVPTFVKGVVPAMIGAVIDPAKTDKQIVSNYEQGLTAEYKKNVKDHLYINEYAKQIPVDGLYFMLYFPDEYNYFDIQRYGYELDYITQFVHELNESDINFFSLLKSLPTDGNQHINGENTAQVTKDGYSVGVYATEKFVFAAVMDADDYQFIDKASVISFYKNVYENYNMRLVAFQ